MKNFFQMKMAFFLIKIRHAPEFSEHGGYITLFRGKSILKPIQHLFAHGFAFRLLLRGRSGAFFRLAGRGSV